MVRHGAPGGVPVGAADEAGAGQVPERDGDGYGRVSAYRRTGCGMMEGVSDDAGVPQYHPGGLVPWPDSDTRLMLLGPGERWFTAEQARRFMAAKPGSRDALSARKLDADG